MPYLAAFMLAAAAGAHYFPGQPWIGVFWGVVSEVVFMFFVAEERGVSLPLVVAYYGLTLVLFPEHRWVFLASPFLATVYLMVFDIFMLQIAEEGFSLLGLTKPLPFAVLVGNYLWVSPAFRKFLAKTKLVTVVSSLVCVGCAIYLLEMIAR
ncbi:hypothetical protein SDD30_14110 [Moorella naiadis]|uniref:hypothetical protein n=1 Tax=Moorella naiadis (nom. illeg.) TaxID=3093670 RepID=UPI003D9CAF50